MTYTTDNTLLTMPSAHLGHGEFTGDFEHTKVIQVHEGLPKSEVIEDVLDGVTEFERAERMQQVANSVRSIGLVGTDDTENGQELVML